MRNNRECGILDFSNTKVCLSQPAGFLKIKEIESWRSCYMSQVADTNWTLSHFLYISQSSQKVLCAVLVPIAV